MAEPWAATAVGALIVWIGMGFGAVVVLWRLYFADRSYRRRHSMPAGFVSLTLAGMGTVTFAAATWAAWLTIRRLLDLEPIAWSPLLTVPLLLLALSTPIGAAAVLLYQRFRY
jgi:heme/copper-type cytochrome/quinol oxidase subunit 1